MIQKLVLCNFKSYKGTIEVDFGPNQFSAIIGPNGVGKSNLMDAISFVFGSSLVDLRTRTFKDLIWRDPQGSKKIGDSFVEAHFEDFVLRRKLGAKAEHFINDEPVNHEEYVDKLESLGISKHNNSLVFQGSIEKMANLSPQQLGELFEQISGSDEYRDEYNELAKEAAEKRQLSAEAGRARSKQLSLVKRLDSTRETLKEKNKLNQRIKKLGTKELALRAALLDCRINESEREIKRLQREKKLATKNSKESSKEVIAVKKQLVQAIRDIQSYEDEGRSVQLASKRATAGLLNSVSTMESATQSLDELEPQLATAKRELELFTTELNSLDKKLANAEKGYKRLLDEVPEYEGDMDLYNKCQQEFACETSLEQAELDRIRRRISALESDLEVLAAQRDTLETRSSQVDHHYRVAQLKVQELESKRSRYNEHEQRLEQERDDTNIELNDLRNLVSSQEQELRQRAQKLKEMQSDKRRADQRNSLLERVQKLKRKFNGVIGVLYSLVQPKEERFTVAIDLILGGNFNAVVVDTIATGRECIEYCQANNLGVMTFLPLDGLSSKPIDSRLREIQGARLAVDAVSYDREYATAIAYACGDALLCDDADIAYSIRSQIPRVKLVSIDGTVLHSNNIITAGGQETNRFDKSRVATLRAQVSDLVEKLKVNKLNESALTQQLFGITERLESLKAKSEQLDQEISVERATESAYSNDLDECISQRTEFEGREEELRDELETCQQEIHKLKRGFSGLRKRIFEPFTATCNTDIDTFQEAQEKRTKLESELERQRLRLQEEIEFAKTKQQSAQDRHDSLKTRHEKLKELHSSAEPKIKEHRETLASAKAKLLELQDKISTSETRVELLHNELSELQGQELDKGDETDELERQIQDLESVHQKAEDQRELIEGCDEELVIELVESLESSDGVQAELDKTQTEIREYAAERENLIVGQEDGDLEEAEETLNTLSEQLTAAQQAVNAAERSLDKVRKKRNAAFAKVLEPVQDSVAEIYKELTTTKIDPLGGNAALRPINESEPFLDGIKFSAMPPRKPFTDISSLSGGEKTIAALALIFALNDFRSSPIYVLDEVDAALDYANVHLVAKYIAKCARNGSQFVVISLKLWFFEHADNLLGVYRKKDIPGSKLVTYELGAVDSH